MKRTWLTLGFFFIGGLAAALFLQGCCSIMHGSSQAVGISSNPSGATVTVDKQDFGTTPIIATLTRKDHHIIHIDLDGYEPFETTLTRSTSGWVWGNIAFGGLIGLAVDAMTGGLYKLTPEQVEANLANHVAISNNDNDQIVIAVVLEPQAGWEKVGTLQPALE